MVYAPTFTIKSTTIHVGKYTVRPMDLSWDMVTFFKADIFHRFSRQKAYPASGLVASTAAAAEVLQLLPEMQWQQEHLGFREREFLGHGFKYF